MKKLFLVLAVLFSVACISEAQMKKYNSYVQVTEANLSGNATAYALATSTKTVVVVVARPGRALGGYVVNLSSVSCKITPVLYGTGWAAAQSVLAQGILLEGIKTVQAAAVSPTNATQLESNRFYFGDYVGAYYITFNDDAVSTFTGSVAVYDAWK